MTLARKKTSSLGIVLVTGVLAFGAPEKVAAADSPRYTPDQVTLAPDQEVLNLRFHAGRTRTVRTYSLMGDGRLFISTSRNASATPELVISERLSDDEISSVVRTAMRSRLYALNSEKLEALRNLERTPGPYISGAGGLEVGIRLSLFPGTAPDGNDELRSNFGVRGSDLGDGAYPSVAELAAIREIVGVLRRAEARAIPSAEVQP